MLRDSLEKYAIKSAPTDEVWTRARNGAIRLQLMSANGMVRPCSWPLSTRRLAGGRQMKGAHHD
jgi:hypothetical protein